MKRRPPIQTAEAPFRLEITYPDGTVHLDEVRPPSAEVYAAFVRELVTITNEVRGGRDPLDGSVQALRAIITYMQGDRTTFISGACEPLAQILAAAHDTLHRGKKNMLHNRPGASGRPTNLEMYRPMACLVLVLDTLIKSGMSEVEATKHLIAETKRANVANPETGDIFRSKELLKLRSNVKKRVAPLVLQELYGQVVNEAKKEGMLAAAATPDGAQRFARLMVMSIAVSHPR